MAGYCTSMRPYFHEPQESENTAQAQYLAILPSHPSNNIYVAVPDRNRILVHRIFRAHQ